MEIWTDIKDFFTNIEPDFVRYEPVIVAWALNGGLAVLLGNVVGISPTQEAAVTTIVTGAGRYLHRDQDGQLHSFRVHRGAVHGSGRGSRVRVASQLAGDRRQRRCDSWYPRAGFESERQP